MGINERINGIIMKQKNYNWIYLALILLIVGGVVYVATKDISPISHHVEKEVSLNYAK